VIYDNIVYMSDYPMPPLVLTKEQTNGMRHCNWYVDVTMSNNWVVHNTAQ